MVATLLLNCGYHGGVPFGKSGFTVGRTFSIAAPAWSFPWRESSARAARWGGVSPIFWYATSCWELLPPVDEHGRLVAVAR